MKKFITMAVALATLAVPAATAQKINDAAFVAKLEKSNAEIANPKKAEKSATWYNRGKICVDAIVAPTKNIFSGLDANMLQMSLGTPAIEVKDNIHSFDWVDIHTKGGKVVAWSIKKEVIANAYDIAREAFVKAYELDPASATKIKAALDVLINHYSELGSVSLDVAEYKTAIDAYMKAVGLQQNPAIGKEDPRYYFFAGQLAAFLGAQDAKYFADGEKYLNKALELGYTDEQGNLIYDVVANPKYETRPDKPDGEFTTCKVLKSWKNDSAAKRPKSITVYLLRDGEVFDTVILNSANNWRYTWDKLDSSYKWTVAEKVPDNYTVTITKEGVTYLITNTGKDEPPKKEEKPPKLPQTGQLWWPVPILAVLGLMFILIGCIRRRGDGYEA
jgi:tetratricopeptide (TPR) repeat protein